MRIDRHKNTRGQAIVLVAFALFAICGMLGLAVDVGWSFFVKKSAQAAADSAALAGASQAMALGASPSSCATLPGGLHCTPGATRCTSLSANDGNLWNACQYAVANGFTDGANNGAVIVTVDADLVSIRQAPTLGGSIVPARYKYWVTVRVSQRIPQLFSAVWGNTNGTSAARATAIIGLLNFNGSLDLLNRRNDPNPDCAVSGCAAAGVNLSGQGGGNIQAGAGMFLASDIAGAANLGGSSSVSNTPFSYFRGGGTCVGGSSGPCTWSAPWTNASTGAPQNGSYYTDPTNTKTQPPLNISPDASAANGLPNGRPVDTSLNPSNCKGCLGRFSGVNVGISGGTGTAADPYLIPSGNYYTANCSTGTCVANGNQIKFDNAYYKFQTTQFGQWVFFGGLSTTSGNSSIQFAPGQYVFAGTNNINNPSFYLDNGTILNETSSASAGEMFLFTNPNYSWSAGANSLTTWGSGSLTVPNPVATYNSTSATPLAYGQAGFKSGNSSNTHIDLHGLDPATAPAALSEDYGRFLMWQDRANSRVRYNGNDVDYSGGIGCTPELGLGTAVNLDNPCKNTGLTNQTSPAMFMQANVNINLKGAIYQPRGAWLNVQGGSGAAGPLQIITGAVNFFGGASMNLIGVGTPIDVTKIALVE